MAIKNATYQVDNGNGFDEIMFKTIASQVKLKNGMDLETLATKLTATIFETSKESGESGINGFREGLVNLQDGIGIFYTWGYCASDSTGHINNRVIGIPESIVSKIDYCLGSTQVTCRPYTSWGYMVGAVNITNKTIGIYGGGFGNSVATAGVAMCLTFVKLKSTVKTLKINSQENIGLRILNDEGQFDRPDGHESNITISNEALDLYCKENKIRELVLDMRKIKSDSFVNITLDNFNEYIIERILKDDNQSDTISERVKILEEENAALLIDSAIKDSRIIQIETDMADMMKEIALGGTN